MSTIAAEQRPRTLEQIVDVATVLLLSLAAVATAWCGYESARWSSERALNYSLANSARIDASTASSLSNTARTIDVNLFVIYENALYTGRDNFAGLLKSKFRPEFKAAFDAWLATHPETNPRAPRSPFVMPQYRLQSDADAKRAAKRADDLTNAAIAKDDISDRYILATVAFAIVSFLGGISGKARHPMNIALLAGAGILFLFQVAIMAGFPVK